MMKSTTSSPGTLFVSSHELDSLPADKTLGALLHHNGIERPAIPDFPVAQIHSFRPGDNPAWQQSGKNRTHSGVAEVWSCDAPIVRFSIEDWQVSRSRDYLFASCRYKDDGSNIAETTQHQYGALFRLLDESGFTQMIRLWNYIPDINSSDANGLERYRGFCLGRSLAFSEHFEQLETAAPAATGIGSLSGDISISLLAKRPGGVTHIENPRQVPAYRYPDRYGPKAPSFARASELRTDQARQIYISGTAAVRGSESLFEGDVGRQLDETLENIAVLIDKRNLPTHADSPEWSTQALTPASMKTAKVYFRHSHDLASIQQACDQVFNQNTQVVYLKSEICRRDLDIEIEGFLGDSPDGHR